LFTQLCFTPNAGSNQTGLESDSEDPGRARSMARSKNVDKSDVPRPGASKKA
jgi:hypothetical protein